MADSEIAMASTRNADDTENPLTRMEDVCRRVSALRWYRFSRKVFKLDDSVIESFKRGMITEDDLYKMIKIGIQRDPRLLRRHCTKIRNIVIRQWVENNDGQIPQGEHLAEAIYNIIDALPIKDRIRFCREELCADPSNLRDCPPNMQLKAEMLEWWWRENARYRNEALDRAIQLAEEFFEQNEGSEKKPTTLKAENLILGPTNVYISRSTGNAINSNQTIF